MAEFWDIYDKDKNPTGRIAERDVYELKEGEYHLAVAAFIVNSKGEVLISKRAPHKRYPNMWEINGGSVIHGENSKQGILRELREELGLEFSQDEAVLLESKRHEELPPYFFDVWLFRKDLDIKTQIKFVDGEATDVKWATLDEFEKLIKENKMTLPIKYDREKFERWIKG